MPLCLSSPFVYLSFCFAPVSLVCLCPSVLPLSFCTTVCFSIVTPYFFVPLFLYSLPLPSCTRFSVPLPPRTPISQCPCHLVPLFLCTPAVLYPHFSVPLSSCTPVILHPCHLVTLSLPFYLCPNVTVALVHLHPLSFCSMSLCTHGHFHN